MATLLHLLIQYSAVEVGEETKSDVGVGVETFAVPPLRLLVSFSAFDFWSFILLRLSALDFLELFISSSSLLIFSLSSSFSCLVLKLKHTICKEEPSLQITFYCDSVWKLKISPKTAFLPFYQLTFSTFLIHFHIYSVFVSTIAFEKGDIDQNSFQPCMLCIMCSPEKFWIPSQIGSKII